MLSQRIKDILASPWSVIFAVSVGFNITGDFEETLCGKQMIKK